MSNSKSSNISQYNLDVINIKVDSLVPYIRNARTHSDSQIAQIAGSVREFGWTNPVLVDGDNGLIAGHGRVAAARMLGFTEVPAIRLDHLSDTQKRALIIADNRLAERAGWDYDMLSLELGELRELDFDLGKIGFDDAELDTLLAEKTEILTDPDDSVGEIDANQSRAECQCPKCGFRFDPNLADAD